MTPDFQQQLAEATRLTRAGNLGAATALIQAALGGGAVTGMPAAAMTPSAPTPDVIDVEARIIDWGPGEADPTHTRKPARPDRAGFGTANFGTSAFNPMDAGLFSARPSFGRPMAADARQAARHTGFADAGSTASPIKGKLIRGQFRHASAGQRDYLLFSPPAEAGAGPRPLVVMLHGCTQNADDFAAGTRMNELASKAGFHVLYPDQSRQHNPQGCWNWFKHNHQQRDRGEPAVLAGMVRQVARQHDIDAECIYVAGLSAGGAMAAILGKRYPDLFAAVGVHSGLAAGAAQDLPSALAAMQRGAPGQHSSNRPIPTIVFHGNRDTTVHPDNGSHVMKSAGHAGSGQSEQIERPGRRSSTRQVHLAPDGRIVAEQWVIDGAGHAWSGGSPAGSFTDPQGPDASAEMWRFFRQHRRQP
ncbi:MAG: PHB depolymerase family esterase [Lautropia sp.]|nr:PHB depolymerase family esterase [Lautropia sp.]